MRLITTTEALKDLCHAFAAAPFVAVDTEFMRETTYWPRLCLIQAASPDAEGVIDPLDPALELGPFLELLSDANVLKVFHAARQDLEIFMKLAGRLPHPVYDTQIAAMAAGHGDSIAYDALVQAVLKRRLDKSSRFTDWSRRPLSDAQLAYALADVTHLRDLYPKLSDRLATEGRSDWVADELAQLLNPDIYDTAPENAWRRLKLRKTAPDYVLALQTAAAWRERQAQARDVPRGRIVKDEALYEIAEIKPKSAADFERMRAVPRGFGNSRGAQELIGDLARAFADTGRVAHRVERPPPLPSGIGPTVELLKVLLRYEAERHQVAPRLIASVSELEAIAANDEADVDALKGWRREVFGARALALKHGRIALRLKNGKVAIEEIG
ncbi:MAG TPA: ribonuclease D [Caulobacterales bacterium]|nr:ribonuclease D [Caulobacterales bacterium]